MPHDLSRHPFFRAWTDPQSGVVSYVLGERVAPVQQTFYFVNPSVSADEEWLWFYTAFPPNPYKTLGVLRLDPARPLIRHFPQSAFSGASPLVLPEGDAVLFAQGPSVWRMDTAGRTEKLVTLDDEYIAHRRLSYLATHLSRSADGRHVLLDGEIGNHWFAAAGDLRSGRVRIVKEFSHKHNHGQFSPVDPQLLLIAQDWNYDAVTGRRFHYDHRIWLLDLADTRFECVTPHVYCKHMTGISHEWWTAAGRIAYVDYERGAFEYDLATKVHTHVWREPLCHAHCDAEAKYWCADESPYKWAERPCAVKFFERASGRSVDIASGLPEPPLPRKAYHIDPHPQFSPRGTWVDYTTTVFGHVDVALAPVDGILSALEKGKHS